MAEAENDVTLTVNLPDDVIRAIEVIAGENGITKTEALKQIIRNQAYLHDQIKDGNKLLLEKDRDLRQVILPTASR